MDAKFVGLDHLFDNDFLQGVNFLITNMTLEEQSKKHTISLLVESKFGAFNRIVGLFAAKRYNIDSLAVGPTDEDGVFRMTIVTRGDDRVIEQITKQLNKLIDILNVVDLTFESFVERDLALVKVKLQAEKRSEIMQISKIFRAKIVDISSKTITLEATGSQNKVDAIITMLKPFGIKEMARTGIVALKRETQNASTENDEKQNAGMMNEEIVRK